MVMMAGSPSGIAATARLRRNHGSGHQHVNQHIVELAKKPQDQALGRLLGQLVEAVLLQAPRGLLAVQTLLPGLQCIEHAADFPAVPVRGAANLAFIFLRLRVHLFKPPCCSRQSEFSAVKGTQ
jgi:hypothetical protein